MVDSDAEQAPATDNQAANIEGRDVATDDSANPTAGDNANGMDGFNIPGGNGAFPAMNNGMGGDMTQMQMMMAMQNGMMPGNFGFPVMGMAPL